MRIRLSYNPHAAGMDVTITFVDGDLANIESEKFEHVTPKMDGSSTVPPTKHNLEVLRKMLGQ